MSEQSKQSMTSTDLEQLVSKKLKMDMSVKSADERIKLLFLSYTSVLRRHGLKWVLESNQKLSVQHVVSAVKPTPLRQRFEADLDFAYSHLRKDLKPFMSQALEVSKAFEMSHVRSESCINKSHHHHHGACNSTTGISSNNNKTKSTDKESKRFFEPLLAVSKYARRKV